MNNTVKGVAAAYYSQVLKNADVLTPDLYKIFDNNSISKNLQYSALYNYIYRLFRKAQIEPECLIASVDYLDEFQKISGVRLSIKNYNRLIFVAIQVASKVWDDVSCSSKSFAMCATDFSLKELNIMERLFCTTLSYELFLDAGDYRDYYYDMKKIWLSLETDEQMEIKGWKDIQCNSQPSVSNWPMWGIAGLRNFVSNDVKQIQLVQQNEVGKDLNFSDLM